MAARRLRHRPQRRAVRGDAAVRRRRALAFCLPLALLVVSIAATIAAGAMPRKTAAGAEEAAKWRAFKRWLADIDKQQDIAKAGELFDRYLPYAIVFGLDKRWIEAFARVGGRAAVVRAHATSGLRPAVDRLRPRAAAVRRRRGGMGGVGGAGGSMPSPSGGSGGGLQGASDQLGGGLSALSGNLSSMLSSAAVVLGSTPAPRAGSSFGG
ncbi:MAG: DUF2207 domain-containing protein [Anaerolineae bacterium]